MQRRGKEHEKGRFLPFQAVVDEIVEGARGKTNERKSERSEYYVEQRRRKRWRERVERVERRGVDEARVKAEWSRTGRVGYTYTVAWRLYFISGTREMSPGRRLEAIGVGRLASYFSRSTVAALPRRRYTQVGRSVSPRSSSVRPRIGKGGERSVRAISRTISLSLYLSLALSREFASRISCSDRRNAGRKDRATTCSRDIYR